MSGSIINGMRPKRKIWIWLLWTVLGREGVALGWLCRRGYKCVYSLFATGLALVFVMGASGILVSQFILPVTTWSERLLAIDRFFTLSHRATRPDFSIQNAKIVSQPNEQQRKELGVVWLNSASGAGFAKPYSTQKRLFLVRGWSFSSVAYRWQIRLTYVCSKRTVQQVPGFNRRWYPTRGRSS